MDNDGGHSSFYAAINRKIMLLSVIIIVIACIVIILFHFYARWFLRRQGRRWIHRDRPAASSSETVKPQGFDASVLKSLPTFTYSSKNTEFPVECAVCISEFEENETCRILTDCKHCFHIDCIDTWLRSHSACPLCRLPVQNLFKSENVTVICEPGCSSSSSTPASTAAADPGNVAGGGV